MGPQSHCWGLVLLVRMSTCQRYSIRRGTCEWPDPLYSLLTSPEGHWAAMADSFLFAEMLHIIYNVKPLN